ncbi:MAG: hypothetical protein MI742_10255 [Desulfobacterales bacterium]|nr:hypothetical protein [Desulfobacterales bacterium]
MGLLSFFIKSPEDLERKGDQLVLDAFYGPARNEYAKALEKLEGKGQGSDAMCLRIEEKYAQCGEHLARQHVAHAEELHGSGIDAEAHHLLSLALDLALEEETKKAAEKILGKLKSAMDVEEEWETEVEEAEEEDFSDDAMAFEALCMSLEETQGDAYMAYGETFKKGYTALNTGRFEEGETLLRAALEELGEASYVPLELAAACNNTGKIDEAKGFLKTFLSHHPGHPQGIELFCHLLAESGAQEDALEVLEGQLEKMTSYPVQLILLKSRLFITLGRAKKADAWLSENLERDWDDNLAYMLATLKKEAGDLLAARKILESSMGRCSGCGQRVPSHIQLAYADLRAQEGDTSTQLIESYLKLALEDPSIAGSVYGAVSQIYRAKGDRSEADRYAKMTQE